MPQFHTLLVNRWFSKESINYPLSPEKVSLQGLKRGFSFSWRTKWWREIKDPQKGPEADMTWKGQRCVWIHPGGGSDSRIIPGDLLWPNTTDLEYHFLIILRVTGIQDGSLIDLGKSSFSNQAVHMEWAGTFKRLTLNPACQLHRGKPGEKKENHQPIWII